MRGQAGELGSVGPLKLMTGIVRFASLLLILLSVDGHPYASEDQAVLLAILDERCADHSGKYYVLASEAHSLGGFEEIALPHTRAVKDLLTRNRDHVPLPALSDCVGVRTASEAEISAALADRPPDPNPMHIGWEGFYARFQGAQGLHRLSLPGYSKDRRTAVVISSASSGVRFSYGFLITLRKAAGRWRIVSSKSLWVS